MLRIAVIDGQGASIGSTIIRKIRQTYGEKVEIWALGTNAIATGQMLKAGANRGATGESAVSYSAEQVDVIVGPISILVSNAMMGELTPGMALAIGASNAAKLLLPITSEPVTVVGVVPDPLPHLVDKLVEEHLSGIIWYKTRSQPAKDMDRYCSRKGTQCVKPTCT
ncbi:MAG: DUF3842 family protein [Syntrophobacteraceae bacterium]